MKVNVDVVYLKSGIGNEVVEKMERVRRRLLERAHAYIEVLSELLLENADVCSDNIDKLIDVMASDFMEAVRKEFSKVEIDRIPWWYDDLAIEQVLINDYEDYDYHVDLVINGWNRCGSTVNEVYSEEGFTITLAVDRKPRYDEWTVEDDE